MRESLSLEPLKEQTHRAIMKLYVANGEKAMALAQFRTCKEVLLHELDAEPDPETQALVDSIALRDVSVSELLRHQATLIPEDAAPLISASSSTEKGASSIAVLPFFNMSGDAE
jgi:DNA-binding SARP family transcriptional activator